MTDEEYVRSVWKRVDRADCDCVDGRYRNVCILGCFDFPPNKCFEPQLDWEGFDQLWSAAADFTRERLEQVRQVREAQQLFRFVCSAMAPDHWAKLQPIDVLTEAELAKLTAGMKPEAAA